MVECNTSELYINNLNDKTFKLLIYSISKMNDKVL